MRLLDERGVEYEIVEVILLKWSSVDLIIVELYSVQCKEC